MSRKNDKPALYVTIGIPGSGKTTFLKKSGNISEEHIFSADNIREEFFGDSAIQFNDDLIRKNFPAENIENMSDRTKNKLCNQVIWNEVERRVTESLNNGFDTGYDGTNISSSARRKIYKKYHDLATVNFIFCDVPVSVAINNNRSRDRQVSEETIYRMANWLQPVTEKEDFDTFSHVDRNGIVTERIDRLNPENNFQIKIPENTINVCRKLEEAGFEAYVVGGCVRDMLLKRQPKDWDITTSASYEQIEEIFKKEGMIIPMKNSREHGVCFVHFNHEQFEIATFRVDKAYSDHRRCEVGPALRIEEDLARRDFTINAMAYRPATGELIDMFNGREDLAKEIIKAVRDPEERINEDALRILRAYRFSCQLGFEIDPQLKEVCQKHIGDLSYVSSERKREELTKIITSEIDPRNPVFAEAISLIVPEFKNLMSFEQYNPWHLYTVGGHTLEVMKNIPPTPELRYAALFHDFGKEVTFFRDENGTGHFYGHPGASAVIAEKYLKELRFDNGFIHKVSTLISLHDGKYLTEKSIKKFISRYDEQTLRELYTLQKADNLGQNPELAMESYHEIEEAEILLDEIIFRKEPLKIKDLKINGNIIKEIGYKDKEIGDELKKLHEFVLEHPEQNQEEILKTMAENDFPARNNNPPEPEPGA